MTWRGLAWVAARQHRTALLACAVVYAVAALLLAVNGARMHDSYAQLGLARCVQHPQTIGCTAATSEFTRDHAVWVNLIPLLLRSPAGRCWRSHLAWPPAFWCAG